MRATITCTACGTVLGIPKAGMPADGLSCNWCGYLNRPAADPKPEPAAARTSAPEAAAPRPAREVTSELAQWSDDETDSLPYAVPPEEIKTRRCEECTKLIDIHAVVCVHCGYDAEKKQKGERTYEPIDREWEAGWPFERRFAIFLACQAVNAATVALSLSGGGSLPGSLFGISFYIFLQAFLLGTYDKVRIRRNKKGQAEITIIWRVCFVPLAPKKLNWREFEGVAWGHYDSTGLIDWWIALVLLPFFIIPAILWWWFVIRADRFYAALARDRGYPDTYLYRGKDERQAKEIAQAATDVTGLRLVTPI
jgi:hypothetical protein